MLAVGNPDGTSTAPTSLLTIEDGTVWYYPGNGGGSLGDPTELGTGFSGHKRTVTPFGNSRTYDRSRCHSRLRREA